MEMTYKISADGAVDYHFNGTGGEILNSVLNLVRTQHLQLLAEHGTRVAETYRRELLGALCDPCGEVWGMPVSGADASSAQ